MKIKALFLGLLAGSAAFGAQQHLNFGGSGPNDGEKAVVAFTKIEANTTEVYGDIDILTADLSSLTTLVGTKQTHSANLDAWSALTAPIGAVVGISDTQVLTNKSISGDQITSAVTSATTATALASNGTNCSSGQYARGVDTAGNAENCTQLPTTEGVDYYGPGGTDVAVVDGGTGASDTATARTNLGLAIGTDVQAFNSNLNAWAGKTAPSGTVLGTSDTQVLTNKSISGSQITSAVALATALAANGTNCSSGQYARGVDATGNAESCTQLPTTEGVDYYAPGGTDVAVVDGGTGSSTASGARTNLGLVIGTDVETHDTDLTTISGLTPTNDDIIQRKAGAWTNRSIAQLKTDIGTVASATALAANGTNCSAGSYSLGVDASGNAEGCTVSGDASTNTSSSVDSEIALFSSTGGKTLKRATGTGLAKITSGVLSTASAGTDYVAPAGNVATATALAANGTNCSAGSYPLGVDASGNSESCTVAGGGNAVTTKVKAADTVRTSTATIADDPDLTFASLASGTYSITGYVQLASANDPGFKMGLKISNSPTATSTWLGSIGPISGGGVATQDQMGNAITTTPSDSITVSTASQKGINLIGQVIVNSTSTLSLQWSQGTSSGTATTIQRGSWMRIEKLN